MIRYLTAGESHGDSLTGILEGFPAGVRTDRAYIAGELARRRGAPGRSARQSAETDPFEILSGLRGGLTTGAPIAVSIKNAVRAVPEPSALPRPGHADLGGMLKYGLADAGLVRERASARETAMRTALGCFASLLNAALGVKASSRVTSLGNLRTVTARNAADQIERARRNGDTLGGEFELVFTGVPAGLGSYAHADRRLGARLGAALLGINGVKGFSVGSAELTAAGGKEAARRPELSGGIDGGVTNGRDIVLRCAVKPVPGLPGGAPSRDLRTLKRAAAVSRTSDITAVFAAAVIAEHVAALELASALLEKFGGDSLAEIKPRVEAWRKRTARSINR